MFWGEDRHRLERIECMLGLIVRILGIEQHEIEALEREHSLKQYPASVHVVLTKSA